MILTQSEGFFQALKDAGCQPVLIRQIAAADPAERVTLLRHHREAMLTNVHNAQRRLQCADYLLYMLRQEPAPDHERDEEAAPLPVIGRKTFACQ